jgi:site-specific DNA-methyltransferase (adenine-specific)
MKPYYENSLVKLYNGKSEDLLNKVISTDNAILVSDPPYNVGYHYDDCKDNMSDEEYYNFMALIFETPSVLIHYPESMYRIAYAKGKFPTKIVSWVYNSNTPRQHRSIAWFDCKPNFKNDGQDFKNPNDPRIAKRIQEGKKARLYDWWEINQVKNISKEKTDHPCQIPLTLMERIIKITETNLIIDPFAGSGTTLLACQNLNRKSIGIEMSEQYCEIIATRLENQKQVI